MTTSHTRGALAAPTPGTKLTPKRRCDRCSRWARRGRTLCPPCEAMKTHGEQVAAEARANAGLPAPKAEK